MYSACTLPDVPAVQGFPSGFLLKGLLGKKWKGLALARWFKSPIPTDHGLKWGNYYHYNYFQVIPRCQDSCFTGEGGFPGPKCSTHYRPSQVGQLQQAEKTDSAGIKIPGLDMATTSSTSVHALKKRRLQIKPGSGLYTAMEFHSDSSLMLSTSTKVSQYWVKSVSTSTDWILRRQLIISREIGGLTLSYRKPA